MVRRGFVVKNKAENPDTSVSKIRSLKLPLPWEDTMAERDWGVFSALSAYRVLGLAQGSFGNRYLRWATVRDVIRQMM